jgi:hypothetical protein
LHLKSGAFGLRLPARLSHMGPWHLGQLGRVSTASDCCSDIGRGG